MPSYHGVALDPAVNPPPWIHTSTGRRPEVPGVMTLSDRQSSSQAPEPSAKPASRPGPCHAMGPNAVASRTPAHGVAGDGRSKRRAPVARAA